MPKILIMEDDPELSYSLTQCLEDAGHWVSACRSAACARTEMEAASYDLLITDIFVRRNNRSLNDGGISLIAWVRARPGIQDMPIIAVSGSTRYPGMETILTTARRIGADMVLEKPLKLSELLAGIVTLTCHHDRRGPVG
ncbi:response regulator [uncultured Roseobacter sp.]|uniref:response regulator n=1 Tax=uncultured Roseobacter sp. TaxID=114847 RepID=UPI00263192EF|nr:response regulator [uncultured Roseobacter sp.]